MPFLKLPLLRCRLTHDKSPCILTCKGFFPSLHTAVRLCFKKLQFSIVFSCKIPSLRTKRSAAFLPQVNQDAPLAVPFQHVQHHYLHTPDKVSSSNSASYNHLGRILKSRQAFWAACSLPDLMALSELEAWLSGSRKVWICLWHQFSPPLSPDCRQNLGQLAADWCHSQLDWMDPTPGSCGSDSPVHVQSLLN